MADSLGKELRTIDLFSGCGAMSLGFANAGFNVVAAFDNWKAANNIYRMNFPRIDVYDIDLSSDCVEFLRGFHPEVVIGGPPCQDFSHAGKRKDLGRADLTVRFAEIVAALKPNWFVMENVDQITKSKKLVIAEQTLKKASYGLTPIMLDASFCGVPQRRKRFFLIGESNGRDQALTPYLRKRLAKKPMTVRDYLGDKLGVEYYYRHPRNYERRAIFSIDEPSPTVRGVNRPIPKNYKIHPLDAARTLTGVRPLTTVERSYLQTFPFDFIFHGTKSELEQMIGNAVPVKLAEFVAIALLEYLKDRESGKLQKIALGDFAIAS